MLNDFLSRTQANLRDVFVFYSSNVSVVSDIFKNERLVRKGTTCTCTGSLSIHIRGKDCDMFFELCSEICLFVDRSDRDQNYTKDCDLSRVIVNVILCCDLVCD